MPNEMPLTVGELARVLWYQAVDVLGPAESWSWLLSPDNVGTIKIAAGPGSSPRSNHGKEKRK